MAAEAVADRSGSGLTNATKVQAVVLDTDLHAWPDGGVTHISDSRAGIVAAATPTAAAPPSLIVVPLLDLLE